MYVLCSIPKKIVMSDLMKDLNNVAAVLIHGYGKHSTDISVGDSHQAGLVRMLSSITPLRGKGQGILLIIFKIAQLDIWTLH